MMAFLVVLHNLVNPRQSEAIKAVAHMGEHNRYGSETSVDRIVRPLAALKVIRIGTMLTPVL